MQPTCDETQSVPRSSSGMWTRLDLLAVGEAQQPFAGAVDRDCSARDSPAGAQRNARRARSRKPFARVGHRGEIGRAAMIDPVPQLARAERRRAELAPSRRRREVRRCRSPIRRRGEARFAGRRFVSVFALDVAGLVDQRESLGEAGERIGVGRRRPSLRRALDDRRLALASAPTIVLVEIGRARPGAVVLGEQLEFALVAAIRRDTSLPSFSG